MRLALAGSGFGPTPPAHPFLASSHCQRAEEPSSLVSPGRRHHRLQNRTPSQGRPAYIKASGTPSTPFFIGAPVHQDTRRRGSPPPISRSPPPRRGRLSTSAPGAPSISFFVPQRFLLRQAEKITSALLPTNVSIKSLRRQGRSFTSAPATPSIPFFVPQRFLLRQAEKITSALLPVDLAIISPPQRGAVSTPGPHPRQPLFSKLPKSPPENPREAVAALRAPNCKITPSVGEAGL